VINDGKLSLSGNVETDDNASWVICEKGVTGHPKKIWLDCFKQGIISLCLSQVAAKSSNKRRGGNQVHLEKQQLKQCVCVVSFVQHKVPSKAVNTPSHLLNRNVINYSFYVDVIRAQFSL